MLQSIISDNVIQLFQGPVPVIGLCILSLVKYVSLVLNVLCTVCCGLQTYITSELYIKMLRHYLFSRLAEEHVGKTTIHSLLVKLIMLYIIMLHRNGLKWIILCNWFSVPTYMLLYL